LAGEPTDTLLATIPREEGEDVQSPFANDNTNYNHNHNHNYNHNENDNDDLELDLEGLGLELEQSLNSLIDFSSKQADNNKALDFKEQIKQQAWESQQANIVLTTYDCKLSLALHNQDSCNNNDVCANPDCNRPLIRTEILDSMRYCHYYGRYYCNLCHHYETQVIPAFLVYKWDANQYETCCFAYQEISKYYNEPILNMIRINHQLYRDVPELTQMSKLREKLKIMAGFIYSCKNSDKLLSSIGSRTHLLDKVHTYSIRDLVDLKKGKLTKFTSRIYAEYEKHITELCECCRGKGDYCETCNSNELIFSFQAKKVIRCSCRAVHHKLCTKTPDWVCGKCKRIKMLSELL